MRIERCWLEFVGMKLVDPQKSIVPVPELECELAIAPELALAFFDG